MPSIPTPDLRPLRQPLRRADLRAARRWLREQRTPTDLPGVGLAVAGWVLLVPGALILLVALTGADDPAMPIVSGILTALGATLLVWRALRRRDALRRAARMIPFARANGLAYAQRALLGPKPAQALRLGFGWESKNVLRAPDGAEWGVWRYRLQGRRGSEELRGYLEIPWAPSPAPTADQAGVTHPLPRGLVEELSRAPLPLDVELASGRIAITARRAWDVDDPSVQMLVHRIRSLVAGQDAAAPLALAPMPIAIASTDAGRRHRTAAIATGFAIALFAIGMAFLQAVVRSTV